MSECDDPNMTYEIVTVYSNTGSVDGEGKCEGAAENCEGDGWQGGKGIGASAAEGGLGCRTEGEGTGNNVK
jgi:hypothetical protein